MRSHLLTKQQELLGELVRAESLLSKHRSEAERLALLIERIRGALVMLDELLPLAPAEAPTAPQEAPDVAA